MVERVKPLGPSDIQNSYHFNRPEKRDLPPTFGNTLLLFL